jgi:tRNA threonylcarbamoyladenosine biosynthesis protein TsaE
MTNCSSCAVNAHAEPARDRGADSKGQDTRALDGSGPIGVADADAMRALGRAVAASLRAGDLVLVSGPLGAGKTTFTQGLAAGLDVQGLVTSPTFVIARVHPSRSAGPGLVHVDAYRLSGPGDIDDLDLDEFVADSITVVEWGTGKVEQLAQDRLEVEIRRPEADAGEGRTVRIRAVGERWAGVDLRLA